MSDAGNRRLTKEERDALAQRARDLIAATNYYMADGGRGLTERDDYILAGGVQRLLDDLDAADVTIAEQAKEIERLRLFEKRWNEVVELAMDEDTVMQDFVDYVNSEDTTP